MFTVIENCTRGVLSNDRSRIESRLKRQKNPNLPPAQQRKDVRFIAALTVGSCIGCVGAIAGGILLGKWSFVVQPNLNSMNQVLMYSYYAIFVLAVIYAFVRGVATALPHLMFITAILLFLLPLTSIIALLIPNIGLWASYGHLWWIDIIAILFALAFLRFYQQAKTRQQHAELGSIWSNVKVKP